MKRNGYTLIELMIVVAIAGILLSVAVQAVRNLHKPASGTHYTMPNR